MLNKGLSISKVILYLAIIAGFTGPAFLLIDIGPFSLFPFRIFLPLLWIIFLLGIIVNNGKIGIAHIKVKNYLLFLALWLVYSVLSLAWAADKTEAIRYNIFLFMGISVIFFVVFCFSNLNDFRRFYALWLIVLVGFLGIGLWNITGHQLAFSVCVNESLCNRFTPTAVFHNPNDYAVYLALSIPFVLAFIRYNHRLYRRLLGMTVLVIALYLLIATLSRANYLAVILGAGFWFLFLLKINQKIKVFASTGLIVVVILVILPHQTERVFETVSTQLTSLSTIATAHAEVSLSSHLNLIRNCMLFLVHSLGFGVGAGNAGYYMAHLSVYDTQGALDPHNWWVEILTDYGLFIFIGYVLLYIGVFTNLFRVRGKLTNTSEKMICEALLVVLVIFFLASMSSGSIMALEPQWLFFAFALGFMNYCRAKLVK
jgi:teichuronic acid biosynthesis protein TuaE